jgi:hypothetical protein
VSAVFAASGAALLGAAALAARLHPRLGVARPSHGAEPRHLQVGE